jgi:hypothetical protein
MANKYCLVAENFPPRAFLMKGNIPEKELYLDEFYKYQDYLPKKLLYQEIKIHDRIYVCFFESIDRGLFCFASYLLN